MSVDNIIRRMGLFFASYQSCVIFNWVVFRVVVGVLSPGLIPAVALVTGIEFLLNAILEIPGGMLADRIGRAWCAMIGLFGLGLAMVCIYLAVLFQDQPNFSLILVIVNGILLGAAKPLLSGSVEGFYQNAIALTDNGEEKSAGSRSFSLSFKHGKFLPAIATVSSFLVLVFLYNTIGTVHAFLVGIVGYPLLAFFLLQDTRRYKTNSETPPPGNILTIIKFCIKDSKQVSAIFLYSIFFSIQNFVMCYLLVSLGRFLGSDTGNPYFSWACMISFCLGSLGFGWALNGYVLPALVARVPERSILVASFSIGVLNHLFLATQHPNWNKWDWIIGLFIYGLIVSIVGNAVKSISINRSLASAQKQNYSTVLSIQNIPGYIFTAAHGFVVARFLNGAPSIFQIGLVCCLLSGTGVIYVLSTWSKKGIWSSTI